MLGHFVLTHDLLLGHLVRSQDLTLQCWDSSHCSKTLRPSVGTLHTIPRLFVLVLGHFVRSQDLTLKCWDASHCPKTLRPSVGTLQTIPRPLILVLGHFLLTQDLVLVHLVLSQDLTLQCWDTWYCPKTLRPSVGTLRTVPRRTTQVLGHFTLSQDLVLGHFALSQDLPLKYWDTSHCPKTSYSSVGTLRTVPRPTTQVLEHFALSQDLVLGHFALSQDLPLKCWDTSHCPKTYHSSVGALRKVPRPTTQVLGHFALSQDLLLGHFALSQDLSLKCWHTSHCPKTSYSSLGTLRTVPRPTNLPILSIPS